MSLLTVCRQRVSTWAKNERVGLIRCLSAEIRLTDLDPRGSGVLLEGTDARSHSEPCSCAITAHTPHNVLLHLLSEHCQLGILCASFQMQLQGKLAETPMMHVSGGS